MDSPSNQVIAAFDCRGRPQKLAGGEEKSWLVGDIVFKPVQNIERYEWASEILFGVAKNGFRVSLPRRSVHGKFSFDGWGAAAFEPGEHVNGRWDEKLQVCRAFSAGVSDLLVSPMPPSDDPWSRAHEIAWEEALLQENILPEIAEKFLNIFSAYQTIETTNQVVHSDLCGNILFEAGYEPLIIDFSPAYRPREYAEAILVADAIAWEDAPVDLIRELPDTQYYRQMLLRAVNFRLIVAAMFYSDYLGVLRHEFENFQPLLEELL